VLGKCLVALARHDEAESLLARSNSVLLHSSAASQNLKRESLEQLIRLYDFRKKRALAAWCREELKKLKQG
jgi:hypothetical protein